MIALGGTPAGRESCDQPTRQTAFTPHSQDKSGLADMIQRDRRNTKMDQHDHDSARHLGNTVLLSGSSRPSPAEPFPGEAAPLVRYGLAGLRRCWMPEHGRWSHKYHLDGRTPPNESVPHSDLYYSINVLLGLAPVRRALAGEPYDLPVLFKTICSELPKHPVRNGAWGMALWAAAELNLDTPGLAAEHLRPLAKDPTPVLGWTAQDVGLSLSGAAAQARRDASWRPVARALSEVMLRHFRGPGALFRDSGRGPRRHFATFATQVYAALSLYQYGELTNDATAIAAANACARTLIKLQGPLGEWPWFYLPRGDRVLDPYEVYSVHQHGMAPAVMHHAVAHDVPGARAAIETGFRWIFGDNEMGISMLRPDLQLIYRSQRRAGIQGRREARLMRAAIAAATGNPGWPSMKVPLELTQEMRSYEFGWLLWSFGGRTDYPAFTNHAKFSTAAT
jgi:hypothetical protein